MSDKTGIPYVDATWNVVCGCTKCSPGCENCYAEKMAYRLACMGQKKYREVVSTDGGVWNGKVFCDEKALDKPLHWRAPRRILVCSMGDLFHESVPSLFIWRIYDIIRKAKQHTFLILTKRPKRMSLIHHHLPFSLVPKDFPHIHLGVTICTPDELWKAEELYKIPASRTWWSLEPLLGEIDARDILYRGRWYKNDSPPPPRPDWVVVGCESGPNRRPCKLEWIRSIVQQCKAAGVGCYVKQLEMWGIDKKNELFETKLKAKLYFGEVGFKQHKILSTKIKKIVTHDMSKFPEDLQVRKTL